jgi:hypothetical protein
LGAVVSTGMQGRAHLGAVVAHLAQAVGARCARGRAHKHRGRAQQLYGSTVCGLKPDESGGQEVSKSVASCAPRCARGA